MKNKKEKPQLIMVSFFKLTDGRGWWILRVYNNETFDYYFSCTQPVHDSDVPRQSYKFDSIEKVVRVGELKDWIAGVIGTNPLK